jgi:hypothetical protein
MRSLIGSRFGRAVLGVGLGAALAVAVVVLGAAGVAGASGAPAGAAVASVSAANSGAIPAPGSIVVVRRSAGHDSLWSVDPVSATATRLVALPFRPARVEQSPGGRRLAYLPTTAGPKVYVYDTHTGTLLSRSLAARGVKVVDSLTWLSSTKLLVAGKSTRGATSYPFTDRLYVLNAVTGASARYRKLAGTEPSVAPAAALLVYVHLSEGGHVSSGSPLRWVFERLYRLKLVSGAKPHLIGSVKYASGYDVRRFHDPRLSLDGKYLITSTTGSDISVSYMVRSAATGKARRTVNTELAGREATAWSSLSDRVAFWSMPLADNTNTTQLLVYKPAGNVLSHSAKLSKVAVTGFAWSANDALLAYSLRGFNSLDDVAELWTIDPTTLSSSTPTDLGAGSMPVFVP